VLRDVLDELCGESPLGCRLAECGVFVFWDVVLFGVNVGIGLSSLCRDVVTVRCLSVSLAQCELWGWFCVPGDNCWLLGCRADLSQLVSGHFH